MIGSMMASNENPQTAISDFTPTRVRRYLEVIRRYQRA